jgi:hypothetical protein
LDEPTLPHGEPYRPLGRRAQIVTILLIIGIGTAIAGIVSGAMERSLLDDGSRDGSSRRPSRLTTTTAAS